MALVFIHSSIFFILSSAIPFHWTLNVRCSGFQHRLPFALPNFVLIPRLLGTARLDKNHDKELEPLTAGPGGLRKIMSSVANVVRARKRAKAMM